MKILRRPIPPPSGRPYILFSQHILSITSIPPAQLHQLCTSTQRRRAEKPQRSTAVLHTFVCVFPYRKHYFPASALLCASSHAFTANFSLFFAHCAQSAHHHHHFFASGIALSHRCRIFRYVLYSCAVFRYLLTTQPSQTSVCICHHRPGHGFKSVRLRMS